jgi:hypothetical protein
MFPVERLWDQNLCKTMFFQFRANVLHQDRGFDSRTSLAGNVALTIGIASGTQKRGLFFRFIADTKSKREKNLKPCSKTSQFSTALHSQAHKRRQTELVTGFSRSHGNVQQVRIIILSLIAIKAYIQFCQSVVMLCSFNLY